jgi:trypsin
MRRHGMALSLILALFVEIMVIGNAISQEEKEIRLGDRKIVGGEATDIQNHPWQVAIITKVGLCGGSVIGERWVLSAAHCFGASDRPDMVKFKAGVTSLDEGIWSTVQSVVIHENYNSRPYENDVALVKLKAKSAASVIPLTDVSAVIPSGQPLEVTGWGATAERGHYPKQLLKGIVPYVDNETCNEPSSYNGRVFPTMICAGHREGGVDSCQGDSGGPLVWRTSEGPVLVGVVSVGGGCARRLKYGVYTRVSAYREWINRVENANRD